MNTSFYTASRGARTQQDKLNVISNNFANINTFGYKAKSSVFQDLMYYNMRAEAGEATHLTSGTGTVLDHTNTNFGQSGFGEGVGGHDYAISGDGFFMLRNPVTNEISYTRNGHFSLSRRADGFYLVTDSGKLVLDGGQNPIRADGGVLQGRPGVYSFANTDGMQSLGENEFVPVAKNGAPQLNTEAKLLEGLLEMSNVDMAQEMANTVEASRAYSYMLKMVQSSDEIEQTINSLRG